MSEAAIEIKDLRVDYGDFVAVQDISLSIPYGQVFGLVGPNGAGKTSTFKVLTTSCGNFSIFTQTCTVWGGGCCGGRGWMNVCRL